jgi:YaiO family outer membrane protein
MKTLRRILVVVVAVGVAVVASVAASSAHAASFEDGLALKKDGKLPQAETVFAEVVRANPEDDAALAEWATVLGWLGRFDDAIAAWKRALTTRPDHVEYVMALARVQYWKGELGAARHNMDAVLAAAPDNGDAFVLAGDICAADHDLGCARSSYGRAQTLAPSAEIERKLAASADPPSWRFDAGGQVDRFDTDRGTEGSFFVQGSFQAAAPLVVTGGYEQLHQFGSIDHRMNVGAYVHPLGGLLISARVAISPTADTVAPWEASGGAEVHVVGPLTALANVRHLDFDTEGVTIVGGGVRLDIDRWSLVGQGGVVASTVNPTQAFGVGKVELAATDAVHLYAGFSRGGQAQPPVLMLPPATATDVVAGVVWQIDRALAFRLDYTYEKYGDSYVRNSLGSAVAVRF